MFPADALLRHVKRSKEVIMELRMKLNVLAAVLSMGFIAAIVFGMV